MFCAQCGVGFVANNLRVFTCSDYCAATRYANVRRAQREAEPNREMRGDCVECGKSFVKNQHNQKLCSWRCRADALMKRDRARGAASTKAKGARVMLGLGVCPHCGESFQRKTKRHVTCSRRCRNSIDTARYKAARAALRAARPVDDRPRGQFRPVSDAPCKDCGCAFRPGDKRKDQCSRCYKRESDRKRVKDRRCAVCRVWFRPPVKTQKACGTACQTEMNRKRWRGRQQEENGLVDLARTIRQMAPPPVEPSGPRIGAACDNCRNWKPMPEADLGGHCDKGMFIRCRPFAPGAKPPAPRVPGRG